MTPPLVDAALAAAGRGWKVFPLCPNDKRPAFPDHSLERCTGADPRCRAAGQHVGWEPRATCDPDRIRRAWSRRPYNVGIACGPSGLVLIDLDQPKPGQSPPEAWQIPGVRDGYDAFALVCERAGHPLPIDTHTVASAHAGTHLYYQHPQGGPQLRNTTGADGGGLGWLIDTRAHGGQVVAAGSIINGHRYTMVHDADPVMLPDWLAQTLTPAPLPPQAPVTLSLGSDRAGRYVQAAIDAQLGHLHRAAQGSRNHALYISAVALGQLVAGGALGRQEIENLLTQAGLQAGLNARETAHAIASGLSAGARRPRTVTT
ncbi:MAG TPA: bifunctional DNA primase/polymerase [Candidatus Limnocylindrales bacterium]|nr:bifunctional DNA primase/polymerase [Candidatus Limnocylindrales bacterium]